MDAVDRQGRTALLLAVEGDRVADSAAGSPLSRASQALHVRLGQGHTGQITMVKKSRKSRPN